MESASLRSQLAPAPHAQTMQGSPLSMARTACRDPRASLWIGTYGRHVRLHQEKVGGVALDCGEELEELSARAVRMDHGDRGLDASV